MFDRSRALRMSAAVLVSAAIGAHARAAALIYNLGTFDGGSFSRAYAVNDHGDVTGDSDITVEGPDQAFRYTGTPGAGGTMAKLGTLDAAGRGYSAGYGINSAGQIAGESYTSDAFY